MDLTIKIPESFHNIYQNKYSIYNVYNSYICPSPPKAKTNIKSAFDWNLKEKCIEKSYSNSNNALYKK